MRLAEAREVALLSQQAVEAERANLEAVLANLSTGVVALERDLRVRVANQAAKSILGAELPAGEELPDGRPRPRRRALSRCSRSSPSTCARDSKRATRTGASRWCCAATPGGAF